MGVSFSHFIISGSSLCVVGRERSFCGLLLVYRNNTNKEINHATEGCVLSCSQCGAVKVCFARGHHHFSMMALRVARWRQRRGAFGRWGLPYQNGRRRALSPCFDSSVFACAAHATAPHQALSIIHLHLSLRQHHLHLLLIQRLLFPFFSWSLRFLTSAVTWAARPALPLRDLESSSSYMLCRFNK